MIDREPRWLARYQDGQRDQVWHEFRQLGNTVRQFPELVVEAQLVCDEMARRARRNVELIVRRLSEEDYRFHRNDDDQTPYVAHYPPTPTCGEHASWLEQRFGAVPLTLLSWVRIVGDVHDHSSWMFPPTFISRRYGAVTVSSAALGARRGSIGTSRPRSVM